jgi:hypothetical protein
MDRAVIGTAACLVTSGSRRSANWECAGGRSFTTSNSMRCDRCARQCGGICSLRVRNTRRGNGSARFPRSVRSGRPCCWAFCDSKTAVFPQRPLAAEAVRRLLMYSCSASLRASIRSLLLPSFSKAFFLGLHTTTSVTCGFSRSYNQAAQVPSSNVTCKSPRNPSIHCRMVLALVSDDTFHYLSGSIHDRARNTFLLHVHTDIFGASHKRVFLSVL